MFRAHSYWLSCQRANVAVFAGSHGCSEAEGKDKSQAKCEEDIVDLQNSTMHALQHVLLQAAADEPVMMRGD